MAEEQTPVNNSENNQEKINEFEINSLVITVHNKIAKWHNDNPNTTDLKFLSLELVEEIAGSVFNHLGLKYNKGFDMDKETKKKYEEEKSQKTIGKNSKSVDDMSNEELMEALAKRQFKS